MKGKRILLFVSALLLIAGPFLIGEIAACAITSTETQITPDGALAKAPAIFKNIVVWEDQREGINGIYMYDLMTEVETRITPDDVNVARNPDVWGNFVVWDDYRKGNYDIYMYDISTGVETQITSNTANQIGPAIYDDTIVWFDGRNGNYDIYMYDISTGVETQITSNTADQVYPDVYGKIIVWTDSRNGVADIYMYNVCSGVESRVTSNPSVDQVGPVVFGKIIVWSDCRNGNADIYMYDVSTGVETQVTMDPYDQYSPDIFRNIIVWVDERNFLLYQDYRGYNLDIYMYDICKQTEIQVTTNLAQQISPAVGSSAIAWVDYRNISPHSPEGNIFIIDIHTNHMRCVHKKAGPIAYGNKAAHNHLSEHNAANRQHYYIKHVHCSEDKHFNNKIELWKFHKNR